VKTGEVFFFQDQHAFAGAGQKGCRRASTRTTANYQRIIHISGHAPNEAQNAALGKYRRRKLTRSGCGESTGLSPLMERAKFNSTV
jgi:hypothetical protein